MAGLAMLVTINLIHVVTVKLYIVIFLMYFCVANWHVVLGYNKWSDHVPLPSIVEKSQLLMLVAVAITVGWLTICFFTLCVTDHARIVAAFAGTMDLIFATMMLTAVILQSTYLPGTLTRCNNYNGQEAVEKMFIYEAEKSTQEYYSSRDVCRSFMGEWILAIAMIIFFLIAAILGIFNPKWKHLKPLLLPFWWLLRGIGFVMVAIWTVLVFICQGVRRVFVVLRGVLVVLSRVASAVRFVVRTWRKWNQRVRPPLPVNNSPQEETPDSSTSDVVSLKKLSKLRVGYPYKEPNTTFECLFKEDKILQAFIRNSHLSDLSRLTLTSKFLHYRLMTGGEAAVLLDFSAPGFLRWKSCQQGNKAQCWCCRIQICRGCSIEVRPGIPQTSCHLRYCEPRCSKCYLQSMCGRKSGSELCNHLRNLYMTNEKQDVCSSCSQLTKEERLMRREEKELVELQHLARHNLRCGLCERRLPPTGPRWWACSECGSECTVDYHPAWSKSPE